MEERGGRRGAEPNTARAWMEVDLGALRRNAQALRLRLGEGVRLLPMVKADGYGLGAVRVAWALAADGVWGFGVATVDEGVELRRAGIEGRIVAFTPCAPLDASRLLEWDLEPVATSLAALREYAAAADGGGGALRAHLEVDTGMGRFGLPADAAGEWAPEVRRTLDRGGLTLASTFTHFHSAESDPVGTRAQWERFEGALGKLRETGVEPGLRHAANGAALVRHPEVHADLVRPGLLLYGGEVAAREAGRGEGFRAEPVVHVRARVLDVRELPAGATVSYGATYRTERPSRVATLGIGYADGLPHALSNRGEALLGGARVPILGAVCMDMAVVDVTGVGEVRPGATATLLGREGGAEIRLDEVARGSGRIPYEILTGFSGRLPRVSVGGRSGPAAGSVAAGPSAGASGESGERIEEYGVERQQPA